MMAADYNEQITQDVLDDDAFWRDVMDYPDYWEDYYTDCTVCGGTTFVGQPLCQTCREEEEDLELLEYNATRGQRREAQREKARRGMVKHLEPNVRPRKMPKPNVRVTIR